MLYRLHAGGAAQLARHIMIDQENKCVCKKSALHVKHKGGWMLDDEGDCDDDDDDGDDDSGDRDGDDDHDDHRMMMMTGTTASITATHRRR